MQAQARRGCTASGRDSLRGCGLAGGGQSYIGAQYPVQPRNAAEARSCPKWEINGTHTVTHCPVSDNARSGGEVRTSLKRQPESEITAEYITEDRVISVANLLVTAGTKRTACPPNMLHRTFAAINPRAFNLGL